jgi:streptogramin lyase/Leucine-rich repeat (LRR) protein
MTNKNRRCFIVKKLSCRRLAIIGASALLFQSSIVFAGTKVYTLDADFDIGAMEAVQYETTHDQLQLSEQRTTLPFIWIANSAESTVSKINTDTGCELGRYRTGPGTGNTEDPSRTTVDLNGDVWVGNRKTSTAVKIALNPTDTNGDGIIITSQDINGNCLIEPEEVLPWGEDEAVLFHIEVDEGPRALAVDAQNNVWIGGQKGRTMRLYNGETAALIKEIFIKKICYGALVDGNGTLWISNDGNDFLTRIDDPAGDHKITSIESGDGTVYGMAIDEEGYIYTSAYNDNKLRKLDPATNTWLYSVPIPGLDDMQSRGVTIGLDGDVWVAHTIANQITRHNAADGSLKATIESYKGPTGMATAKDGKIWVSNRDSNNVMRIDPATNAVDFTHKGHTGPYNYSDMTGIISRGITTRTGTWTAVYQEAEIIKATVSWTADTPGDSTIIVMAESSVDGMIWSAPQQVQSGVEFNTVANATKIRVVVKFTASTGALESPILYDLTIDTPEPSTLQIDDSQLESNETLIADLNNISAELGTPNTAVVTITDNDLAICAPEPSILQFSSANYSVDENGGSVTITVTRSGGSQGAISIDYATSDYIATADSDYIATSGTLNWADGDATDKTITIDITDDSKVESNETFIVGLSNVTGVAELGSPNTAEVTITDDDLISCATVTEIPSEECEALLAIYKSTNGKQWKSNTGWTLTTTPCSWYGIECYNGHVTRLYLQYNQLSGTIPPEIEGLSNLEVLNIKDNEICGEIPDELMNLSQLWYLNTNHNHLSTSNTDLIIWLNGINQGWDTTQPPCSVHRSVQFTAATYNMTENGEQATITVTRSGDSQGAISVDYATSDDTASAAPCENDYSATTGTLHWANGDSDDKTFTINVNDDSQFENDETLIVRLSNPTGGIELGTPDTVVLTITDNDSPSTAFDCTTITGIPSTECTALVSLYEYTNGSQWRNNTGWKITETPCNWYGVTCENGHVTRLNLQHNRLNGSISWMIGKLSHLKVLALNNNQLRGNIPSGIGNWNSLSHINLANNQLRGSIPTSLGNSTQLQCLLLENNNLHGNIPATLVKLNDLLGLSLDTNHLEAQDPALIPWLSDRNPSWEATQTPP